MGNYIDADTLEERMGDSIIADLTSDADDYTAFIDQVIARSEGIIDAFARKLYTVPLTASGMTEEWALVLAEYELYKRGQGNNIPEKYKESRKDVLDQLKMMSEGLLIPDGATRSSTAGNSIDVTSDDALFTESATSAY